MLAKSWPDHALQVRASGQVFGVGVSLEMEEGRPGSAKIRH